MATVSRPRGDLLTDVIARLAADLGDQLSLVRAFFAGANLAPVLKDIASQSSLRTIDVDVLMTSRDATTDWPLAPGGEALVHDRAWGSVRFMARDVRSPQTSAAGTVHSPVLVVADSLLTGA